MSPVSTSNMKHSKLTTTSAVKHTKSPLSISHLPPTSDNDPQLSDQGAVIESTANNAAETSADKSTPSKYNLLKREIKQLAEVGIANT
jgi:hypothetical protein